VAPFAAAIIGLVAGILVCVSVWFWDNVAHVDDPCGAVSVHGVCGVWGLIALGLFADGTYGAGWNGVSGNVTGIFYGDGGQLVAQLISVGVSFAWAFGVTTVIFGAYKMISSIRVTPEVEIQGLDLPEFGVAGYSGFVMERELHGYIPEELLVKAAKPTAEPGPA
jgi:Amt family ammonium transporter